MPETLPAPRPDVPTRPAIRWRHGVLAGACLGLGLVLAWGTYRGILAGGGTGREALAAALGWTVALGVGAYGLLLLLLRGRAASPDADTTGLITPAPTLVVPFQCKVGRDGRLRYARLGTGAAALFGLQEAELAAHPGKPWELLGAEGGRPVEGVLEATLTVAGRERRIASRSAQSVHHGELVHGGYWMDVTREHQAQVSFEQLFARNPCPGLLLDARGAIKAANAAAVSLFAAPQPSALAGLVPGQPPLAPPGAAGWWAPGGPDPANPTAGTPDAPLTGLRLDGSRFEGRLTLVAMPTGGVQEAPEGRDERTWVALIEDVTAQRRAEDALRRAHEAEQSALQAKSAFLSNMSHEIRTPMNAIIGMTHLALEDPDTTKHRSYVAKAHQAAKSLLEITNDILDLARIESGQLELECVEFTLQGIIDHLGNVLGIEAERKGLELLFAASPDLPTRLLGDPTRLRQIMLHLGSNAVKFTDRGSVTLGLEVQHRQGVEIELHGWVRDTGIGISEDRRAALFLPFTQADNSTTRRFGGSGLGLSICHHLVRRMNGRLWVDSQPGHGSTFHFTLRLHLPSGLAPSEQLRDDWTGRRALLADDNADAREVLGTMLRNLGVTVDVAASGSEALARLEEAAEPYDWIMLDWKMPSMDGLECAGLIHTRLRRASAKARPCILLVTAFNREEARDAAGDVPLADVLTKPITPTALADCLRRTLTVRPLKPHDTPEAPQATPDLLAGARILLVEDHPLNQELARELLHLAGAEVVCVENGALALTALSREGPFDCVLMDCQMPVMDGYTATRKIRQHPQWLHLPVLAMTASALPSDREHALASGMNDHIAKPLDVAQTYRVVSQWVEAGRTVRTKESAKA